MPATPTAVSLNELQRTFIKARDISAPLVVIRTADPAATLEQVTKTVVNNEDKPAAIVRWDTVRGFEPLASEQGKPPSQASQSLAQNLGGKSVVNATQALENAHKAPPYAAVFMMNGHDYYNEPAFRQALWNLRDPFKRDWRTLVITQPTGGVPMSLEHDVLTIDEPLPGPDELAKVIRGTFEAARLTPPKEDVLTRAVDAVAGLSAFAAEQAVALSLTPEGLDQSTLRDRHRQMIENTKGLTVWRGRETFDAVGGLNNFKNFGRRFLAGRYRVGSVLWIDEVEKALAGVKGDLTGISQDYLATMLSFMTDHEVPGILLMGHPGTGKSALSKAIAGEAGVPCVRMDMGAMHGSLVGESQHAIRHALKVATAVSQDRLLVVATCNSVAILPPEFVNRFKWRFFVDLPDKVEKEAIWPIHRARYEIEKKDKQPDDTDWNGREIEQCCATAYTLRCSLREAAETVVPVAQSSAEAITRRRDEAKGRYLSASVPGPYTGSPVELTGARNINLRSTPTWEVPGTGKPS